MEPSAVTGKSDEPLPAPSNPVASYRRLVESKAAETGLPPQVADAVMAVESGYDPNAVGSAGEIGLMQVLPSTARMLGFTGTSAELAAPEINTRYGVAYLAEAWRLAGGDLCTAVMKYRAGHGETRFSQRSVDYCLSVRAKLSARGYPVTGRVPVATFGSSPRSRPCRPCLGGSGSGVPDLAGLNKKLNDLARQTKVPIRLPGGQFL